MVYIGLYRLNVVIRIFVWFCFMFFIYKLWLLVWWYCGIFRSGSRGFWLFLLFLGFFLVLLVFYVYFLYDGLCFVLFCCVWLLCFLSLVFLEGKILYEWIIGKGKGGDVLGGVDGRGIMVKVFSVIKEFI